MRIVAQPLVRARNSDTVEQLRRALVGGLAVHVEVRLERFADLTPDRQHRVQRRHRILEDHRDLPAPNTAQSAVALADQVLALEDGGARLDPAVAGEQTEDRERRDALAATRLADDPKRLAGRDVERDPVDGVHGAAPCREADVQILDGEEGFPRHGHAASDPAPRAGRPRSD